MSKKLLTPQEFRQELLKQTQLEEAFATKKYYEDGAYKPGSVYKEEIRKQSDYYNAIDRIGLRIASELFSDRKEEGQSYRNETKRRIDVLIKQINEKVRTGQMTPTVYDDLMGYMSTVFGTSFSTLMKERQPSKVIIEEIKDTIEPVQKQIAQNLTQLPSSAIKQLGQNLGETSEGIKQLVKIAERFRLTPAPTQARTDGGVKIDEVDGNPNISMNIPFRRQGEINEQVNHIPMPHSRQLPYIPVDAGDADGQGRSAFEIWRQEMESQEGMTQRYGLSQGVYEKLMGTTNNILFAGLDGALSTGQVVASIDKLSVEYKRKHSNFTDGHYKITVLERYQQMTADRDKEEAEHANASASAEAIAGNQMGDIMKEKEDFESGLNDKHPIPKHTPQAQRDASAGMLGIPKQIAQQINDNDEELLTHVMENIINRQRPVTMVESAQMVNGELIEQLHIIHGVNGELQKIVDSGTIPVIIPISDDELEALKSMFSVQTLGYALGQLRDTNYKDWDTYQEEIEQFDSDDDSYNEEVGIINNINNDIYVETATAIGDALQVYRETLTRFPLGWALKEELSSTNESISTVFNRFLDKIAKQKAPEVTAKGRGRPRKFGGTRYDAKEYYQPGAPARTAQVPDPAMRYEVGGRKMNKKYTRQQPHDIMVN